MPIEIKSWLLYHMHLDITNLDVFMHALFSYNIH